MKISFLLYGYLLLIYDVIFRNIYKDFVYNLMKNFIMRSHG